MKILKFKNKLHLQDGDVLEDGRSYVMSDHMAQQLLSAHNLSIESTKDLATVYNPLDGSDLTNKKLLVWRSGGIGDLLFITPNLQYLLNRYPGLQIRLACAKKYAPLFEGHEFLHDKRSWSMPFPAELLEWADFHLHFEGAIENGGKAEYMHAVDLFASEYFKIPDLILPENRRPVLAPTYDIDNKIKNMIRYSLGIKSDATLMAVQLRASSPIRTFPERRMMDIIHRIAESRDVEILLLDNPALAARIDALISKFGVGKNIHNISKYIKTIRETIALIKKIDILIAPDSSLTHIAGAQGIDKPTLALYGPFPSFVRTKYYPNCIALNCKYKSDRCRTPCYKHGHSPCPEAELLGTQGESPCFSTIKNKTVIYAINKLLDGIKNHE